jgi:hypothetical protein
MKNHRIMSKGDNEMGLFLKSYKIAYITSVGELNEAKINRLKYFIERYPVIARQQGGPGVLLLNPINSCSIVLLPNRIVLDYNGENLNINRQQVQKDFEELVDKLILESTGAVTFHYIANLEDKNKDSMRTSLKNMQRYELKNVVGLGARFLYNFDDDFWEF